MVSGLLLLSLLFGPRTLKPTTSQTKSTEPVTLQFWGVFDDASVFQPVINEYQAKHPNVKIIYTQKDISLYEFASLNLLAGQTGPDIWLIPSEWLPKHHDKLSPVPEGFLALQNIAPTKTGLFQKKPAAPTNAALYPQLFAQVTAENNLVNNKVYALPLSVDTLGLYANTQLLQNAGIKTMPTTWDEVVADVKLLGKHDATTISQPGINMGTGNNIARATDILATLMMQNHTPMVTDDKRPANVAALFNQNVTKSTGEPVQPGPAALDFYTSFASPTKETFSWSGSLGQDFDLFTAGQLPLFIDYSYRTRAIAQKSPTLQFTTGPLPQVSHNDRPLTMATSQIVGVPVVSSHSLQAWDFIKLLTDSQHSLAYSRAALRPPARLALLQDQLADPHLQPFAAQVPYATTWYRNELNKTDTVMKQAIDAVLAGQPVTDVATKLTKQVTHILRNEPYE